MSHQKTASPAAVQELLTGSGEFLPPGRLLHDLTEEQARLVPPGSPHSITQIVAHMQWWQAYQIARIRGEEPPRPEHLDDTFAPPSPGEWAALVARFLAGLDEVDAIVTERGTLPSPGRDDADIAYSLTECPTMHNAYHLGQIALLRQMQGFWPPEGGDESW